MKAISGKDLGSLLERNGWQLKRVKGSHHVYAKEGNPRNPKSEIRTPNPELSTPNSELTTHDSPLTTHQ